jgi:hypothetical protein
MNFAPKVLGDEIIVIDGRLLMTMGNKSVAGGVASMTGHIKLLNQQNTLSIAIEPRGQQSNASRSGQHPAFIEAEEAKLRERDQIQMSSHH